MDNFDDMVEILKEYALIQLYLDCIDNKKKNEIQFLFNKTNKYNIGKDVVLKMYNRNQLNSERLQFIMENCSSYLNVSSNLLKS